MWKTLIKEYKNLENLKIQANYSTHHFFQYLINKKIIIKPTYVLGKFMEIDTYNDFNIAKNIFLKKYKPVYVPLAVDILHSAHINILKTAKKYGKVIAGLLTDKAISRL